MTNDGTIIRLRNVYKLPKRKMEPSMDLMVVHLEKLKRRKKLNK